MAAKRIKIDNASSKFRRQSQKREQKVIRCSVLIVCEGTKTEPNYFEAFAEKQQGVIVYDIEVKGLGRGTKDVVEKAIDLKIIQRAPFNINSNLYLARVRIFTWIQFSDIILVPHS